MTSKVNVGHMDLWSDAEPCAHHRSLCLRLSGPKQSKRHCEEEGPRYSTTINNYWACLVSCGPDTDMEARQTKRRHIKASLLGQFTPVNDLSGQQWPCNTVWSLFRSIFQQGWQVEPGRGQVLCCKQFPCIELQMERVTSYADKSSVVTTQSHKVLDYSGLRGPPRLEPMICSAFVWLGWCQHDRVTDHVWQC